MKHPAVAEIASAPRLLAIVSGFLGPIRRTIPSDIVRQVISADLARDLASGRRIEITGPPRRSGMECMVDKLGNHVRAAASRVCACSPLMHLLEDLSVLARVGISDAYGLNLNLGETTITDLCMLAIGRSPNPNIKIAAARGRDEPDKGFDWEWSVRYPASNWL